MTTTRHRRASFDVAVTPVTYVDRYRVPTRATVQGYAFVYGGHQFGVHRKAGRPWQGGGWVVTDISSGYVMTNAARETRAAAVEMFVRDYWPRYVELVKTSGYADMVRGFELARER